MNCDGFELISICDSVTFVCADKNLVFVNDKIL